MVISARTRRWLHALIALSLLGSLLAGIAGPSLGNSTRAAELITLSRNDRIDGPPRGSVETVMNFARASGAGRIYDLEAYAREVYRLAPMVAIDPAFVVTQSALETGNWTHYYWTSYLNPAGIGTYYGGAPSYTWSSGVDAARFQIALLYIYVHGEIPRGHLLYPYLSIGPGHDGPRQMGYVACCKVINDLSNRWAVDPNYGLHLENRGNQIFKGGTTSVSTQPQAVHGANANAGNDPARVLDGDLNTTWAGIGGDTPPRGAYLQLDLGVPIRLSSISWYFRLTGYADRLRIRVSEDGINYTTIHFGGNAPAKTWQTIGVDRVARYVRFNIDNPNGDLALGYIAEVRFFGTPVTPVTTPTATPTSTPAPSTPLTLAGSGGSKGATFTGRIRDGRIDTDWRTTDTPAPATGYVYIDLGAEQPIGLIEWVFSQTGGAPELRIDVSNDKRTWTTLGSAGDAPANAWQQLAVSTTARYVRWFFVNTTGVPVLGYLAEVRITQIAVTPPRQSEPEPVLATLAGSGGSKGATFTGRIRDGRMDTDWRTTTNPAPESAFVYIDLGAATVMSAIEWVFNQTGGAPELRIEVSDDKRTWTTVGTAGDAEAGAWQRLETQETAQYVRWRFVNTTGVPVLGYLAEVRITETPASIAATTATATVTPTETATETALPTETPATVPVSVDTSVLPVEPAWPVVAVTSSDGIDPGVTVTDGQLATGWQTAGPEGYLQIDLGAPASITDIAWLASDAACAANLTLLVSEDGVTWVEVATALESPAWTWLRLPVAATAQFVRWQFTSADPASGAPIGCLADVIVWGGDTTISDPEPAETVVATETATTSETATAEPSGAAPEEPPEEVIAETATELPAETPTEPATEVPADGTTHSNADDAEPVSTDTAP